MNQLPTPEAYEMPTVTAYGTIAGLTAGSACPEDLDADFPAGTPFGQLTCS